MLAHLDAVDVVLTDVKMPHMDGVSAATIIKQRIDKRLPIIAITGFLEKYLETEGLPFDKILRKPLVLAEVITCIELAVGLRLAHAGPDHGRQTHEDYHNLRSVRRKAYRVLCL